MTLVRRRKAWSVYVRGLVGSDVYFGPSAGVVRYSAWLNMDGVVQSIIDIRVLRNPTRDVFLPIRHELADKLTEEETSCLLHAWGADQGDPFKAGYRTYFYTDTDDERCVSLVNHGLMTRDRLLPASKDMTYFTMTKLGIEVAQSLVLLYPTWMTKPRKRKNDQRSRSGVRILRRNGPSPG